VADVANTMLMVSLPLSEWILWSQMQTYYHYVDGLHEHNRGRKLATQTTW
jgi:hypothetical protein